MNFLANAYKMAIMETAAQAVKPHAPLSAIEETDYLPLQLLSNGQRKKTYQYRPEDALKCVDDVTA
jgi:hypothetical protein